jgi:hypothetical protein
MKLFALCVLAMAPSVLPAQTPLDLSEHATAFATHVGGKPSAIQHLIDGDPTTFWHGGGKSLQRTPQNVVVKFNKPRTLCRVDVTSQVFKNALRLKDFSIYAWGTGARGTGAWAGAEPLAVVRNFNKDSTQNTGHATASCTFDPVTTSAIRIRIEDTWRPDHAWPRIGEVQVWTTTAPGRAFTRSPIPEETREEQLLCDWAMGIRKQFPLTKFDPARGYLHYARTFADTMIATGTDIYGEVPSPMFVSILMVDNQKHPNHLLPCIHGQRTDDRANHGGNLHHDIMLLKAMDLMTSLTGNAKYKQAAGAYLRFFLDHCPSTTTGLFPWGEHAHWDFYQEKPGHLTHELLGGVPLSFWEQAHTMNPAAVRGEADGLLNHILNLEAFTWSRHASITVPQPTPRQSGYQAVDFPRHGGFYITLWTFAHAATGDARYLDWAMKTLDHLSGQEGQKSGLPPLTEYHSQCGMESALSLALSLLEAAGLLPEGPARQRYLSVANRYLDAIERMPHQPAEGFFALWCDRDQPPEQATGKTFPWTAAYGGKLTADDAVLCCLAHRLTGRKNYLHMAEDAARFYTANEPPGPNEIVRAHVYAAVITLLLDLHSQTHKGQYLAQAKQMATLAIERLYWQGLFRGATGIGHYESQMMVSNLVYALVWLHVEAHELEVKVEPNYFNR